LEVIRRYRRLLERCPQVVQMLSLKDIASFFKISPIYLSKIRKELTVRSHAHDKSEEQRLHDALMKIAGEGPQRRICGRHR
jgi:YesN/AraC family two-component response regulator